MSPPLPPMQARVLAVIRAIHAATGEGAPRALLARKFHVTPMAIQGHAAALYRKGLLRSPSAPFVPADPSAATTSQLGS